MSKPSPPVRRRPAVIPKPSSLVGNAETVSPGTPPSPPKKSAFSHQLPSPKTPPRSPRGKSKFALFSEKVGLHSETQPPQQSSKTDTFGLCLQSAREQINTRHQGELQVLEGFRNYMHRRAKADGEYVAALTKIHSQTAREVPGVGTDSSIGKVGQAYIHMHIYISIYIYTVRKSRISG